MAKILALLAIIAVVVITEIFWKNESESISESNGQTATASVPADRQPETLGVSTVNKDSYIHYEDDDLGFGLDYPEGLVVKKGTETEVVISGSEISISLIQERLTRKDTVNTVAEQDINEKKEKMGGDFVLSESISPVAIGALTGITYTAYEFSKEVTVFYVPQGSGYLKITNETQNIPGKNLLSLSDQIIYSLELIQK